VNEVEWHEVENLAELEPIDLKFITRTSDDDKTTVIFGNGQQGARLPTGIENIRAIYRSGIGKAGNVKAAQISLLMTRPLGVKEVINPLRASGGADKESRDQARKNTPLAVLALDRLVSTQDYADFTRKFAGIGKASAVPLSDGNHQLVQVTIAGADDIPIDKSSDLYQSLFKALHDFGDPYLPIQVEMRELILILISANVRILPDYLWESVATKIRIKLLDTFSFERRELGQDVLLSEVISAIQSVEGVAYVDVDLLGGVSEKNETGALRTPKEIAEMIQSMIEEQADKPNSRIRVNLATKDHPAQIAFLTPDVEATLILNEVKL
jgi:predicted phage baseplate assembly protein